MSQSEQALQQIINSEILKRTDKEVTNQINRFMGRRILAVVESDPSYDPDLYDPAYDEAEFDQMAA